MRSRMFIGPVALLVLGSLAGCTLDTVPSAPAVAEPARPAAPAPTDAAARFAFQPSNVPLAEIDFREAGDVVISDATCGIDTDNGAIGCATGGHAVYKQVAQGGLPAAVPLGVFLVKSLRVEEGVKLRVRGSRALVIIAENDIELRGALLANATSSDAVAGGFTGTNVNAVGQGPGAGGAGSVSTSGAGGSLCGNGGVGAGIDGAGAAPAGPRYGSVDLIPLVAGSSGGQGTVGQAGAGGGAVELVAFKSLTIGKAGVVHVGGGGGAPGGGAKGQNASGGGSGGAILLEGSTVAIAGTLAANGGGGGQGALFAYGADATADGSVAPGADKDGAGTSVGGNGGASSTTGGTAGHVSSGMTAGAGGGGVGRIRINSLDPDAVFGPSAPSGFTISPARAPDTGCTTLAYVLPVR